jgi:hypothetical protein
MAVRQKLMVTSPPIRPKDQLIGFNLGGPTVTFDSYTVMSVRLVSARDEERAGVLPRLQEISGAPFPISGCAA